jgi:lipopolysaccharide transport system permease protein
VSGTDAEAIIEIRPARGAEAIDWAEAWRHRELVGALVRRELQARYRQTFASVLWILGQPLLTMIILTAVVTRLQGSQPGPGMPTPLFVYVALVPWSFVSHALTKLATCFSQDPGLVTRVYLPRILIPVSVTAAATVDLAITLLFLPVLLLIYGVTPTLAIAAAVWPLLVLFAAVLGLGLWLAPLNAEYRDVTYALPFLLQLGMFATPIFYSSDLIPGGWRLLYAVNPLVGTIEGLRWCVGGGPPPLDLMLISSLSAACIVISGLHVFRRCEPRLADVV